MPAYYLEFFQHKKAHAPQYTVTTIKSVRSQPACINPATVKPTYRLAFENAQREIEEIQRIRQVSFITLIFSPILMMDV
jgi:hypothetical protein